MLELKNIRKIYNTQGIIVEALKEVSIDFRDNEFVSILGQSGCGKTTLLNIIGGLDKYNAGDLVINGVSTKDYNDHDWDIYRNNTIGFVFQSYNLIPHQTVLSNVELSLTLSGVNKKERRERAIEALKKVGLEEHINKKPNQLSGGQMQRVAIARAIVNNPKIVLADEPTGALDTTTSIQVMDILKEIAKDRLVIMVTHNPSLAEEYSTRIVKLLDGNIVDDSNKVSKKEKEDAYKKYDLNNKRRKKLSMSFFTALSLSFKNLMTKKGRTILTSFAGSIGIIGIALILSLSSGFQNYINKVESQTLSVYPLEISKETVDLSGFETLYKTLEKDEEREEGYIYSKNIITNIVSSFESQTNDLESFKTYLEDNADQISEYINDIEYNYSVDINIYNDSDSIEPLYPFAFSASALQKAIDAELDYTKMAYTQTMLKALSSYSRLINNDEFLNEEYNVLEGKFPEEYNEIVLVVDKESGINDYIAYALGLMSSDDLVDNLIKVNKKEEIPTARFSYNELLNKKVKLVAQSDYYSKSADLFVKHENKDTEYIKDVLKNKAIELKVVGILSPKSSSLTGGSTGMICYNNKLVDYLVEYNNASEVAVAQKASPEIDVLTGKSFTSLSTIDNVYAKIGAANSNNPDSILIYSNSFEGKDKIKDFIKAYNDSVEDSKQIKYSDYVGILMDSVTTIVNAISYVLIAFVSISLVVSSIMIGIITNISVLERTKEIGILRSIGASKKDIKRVFNAETFFLGLTSGVLGIAVTILLDIPINIVLKALADLNNIAKLPTVGGIVLVVISVCLTLIAGLIPASKAAKQDPVVALRTE